MKKLMMAAAIVCAAAFANATTVNWSVLGVEAAPGSASTSGYWAYAFLSSDSTLATANVISSADVIAMINAGQDPYDYGYTYGFTLNGSGAGVTGSTAFPGQEGWSTASAEHPVNLTGYLVIIDAETVADATHYMLIENDTLGQGALELQSGSGDVTFAYTSATTWNAIGAAPEPTSGLLLLIGVAGLALRRRRA